jgi:hypothetical protein
MSPPSEELDSGGNEMGANGAAKVGDEVIAADGAGAFEGVGGEALLTVTYVGVNRTEIPSRSHPECSLPAVAHVKYMARVVNGVELSLMALEPLP